MAVVMAVAGLVTLLFHRLRQPVVLGYILAGLILGPHTPPHILVHSEANIATLADLGVILLMFSLGLHFSLRKLKEIGASAFLATVLEIALMLGLGYAIGRFFHWSAMDSLFLGAILSVSSTTIIVKALHELGLMKEKFADLTFGILVIEDIFGITMIALLSGIALSGSLQMGPTLATIGNVGLFLCVALVVGLMLVPPFLRYVDKFKSDEMLLVVVLGLCFGVSLAAVKAGYSSALGAFLIGTVVGEAKIEKIQRLAEPVRDMFGALFFVSVGMLIDPALIVKYAVPVTVITVAVVVGKIASCSLGAFGAGKDLSTSLRTGMSMAQIGEFSFIIASLGLTLNVTSDFLYPIAVAVSAITTLLTPYLIRGSGGAAAAFDRHAPGWLSRAMQRYTAWAQGPGSIPQGQKIWPALFHTGFQMAVSMTLITAAFFAVFAFAGILAGWLPPCPQALGGLHGLAWFLAVLITLPGIVTIVRHLQFMVLLVTESGFGVGAAGWATRLFRAIIGAGIMLFGGFALGVWLLKISGDYLPSGPALALEVMLLVVLGFAFRKTLIRIHGLGEIVLRASLSPKSGGA